jgi:hypothetical protein
MIRRIAALVPVLAVFAATFFAAPGVASAQDACVDVPDPISANLRPAKCVAVGTELRADVYGFKPDEQIGFWVNAPSGEVVGTVQTMSIGPVGAIYDIPLGTEGLANGTWSMVFQGTESGHQSVIYFKIYGGQDAPAPAPSDVPAAINAVAYPASGPRGTVFAFQGWGFAEDEPLGVYITAPDQSVVGAPFQVSAGDDGVSEVVTFNSGYDIPAGVYAITFEGTRSGHKAIAYFRVTE